MVKFLAKHWFLVLVVLVALGLLIAYPGAVVQLVTGAVALIGLIGNTLVGILGGKGQGAVGGNLAGAKADVDSSLAGLQRTAEEGQSGARDAKATLDDGASAIDRALSQDQDGKS